jgi:hypothetical protein
VGYRRQLLEECGPPGDDSAHNGSKKRLEEAQAEFLARGIDRKYNTLRDYRDTSFQFPPEARASGVSHRVHIKCGSPKMLQTVLAGWPEGKKVTVDECVLFIKELERRRSAENAAEYNDRHNAAKSKVETVEKHVEAAKQAETQATTFDDRRQAKEIRESVEREFKKAQEDLYNVPKLPKGDPLAPPRVNEVPDILLVARLMGTTGKAQELSEEATKMLNDAGPRTFDPDLIGAVIEAALTAAEKWREFAKLLQGQGGAKGSYLTIVGGE